MMLMLALMLAAPTADRTEKVADPQQRIVCKRFVKTGSLIDSYRTCKTQWEWERERNNVRDLSSPNSCGGDGGCANPN